MRRMHRGASLLFGAIELSLLNRLLKKVAAAEVGPQLPGKYSPETMLVWDFSGEGEGDSVKL